MRFIVMVVLGAGAGAALYGVINHNKLVDAVFAGANIGILLYWHSYRVRK